MSDYLNYYSKYNRIKDHQQIDSLLSFLSLYQDIKLMPIPISQNNPNNLYHEEEQDAEFTNKLRKYEEYLQQQAIPEDHHSSFHESQKIQNAQDPQNQHVSEKESSVKEQTKKLEQEVIGEKDSISKLLQTDEVHESVLDSEEEEHSEVIEHENILQINPKKSEEEENKSIGMSLQNIDETQVRKSNVEEVNTIMPEYISVTDSDIEVESRSDEEPAKIDQQQYKEEEEFEGYNEIENRMNGAELESIMESQMEKQMEEADNIEEEQNDILDLEEQNESESHSQSQQKLENVVEEQIIEERRIEKIVSNLEQVKETESYNEHLEPRSQAISPVHKEEDKIGLKKSQSQRKPFKKFLLNKKNGLNPRLVTSTILQEQKPKKVNFKKVIKKTASNAEIENTHEPKKEDRKEEKLQKKEDKEKKNTVNKLLLQAFFEQN